MLEPLNTWTMALLWLGGGCALIGCVLALIALLGTQDEILPPPSKDCDR